MNYSKLLFSRNSSLNYIFNNIRYPRQLRVFSVKPFHQSNNDYQKDTENSPLESPKKNTILFYGVIAGTALSVLYLATKNNSLLGEAKNLAPKEIKFYSIGEKDEKLPDGFKPGLPTFGYEEVSKHTTKDARIWVTYKNGVYDITDFAATHPGGNQILEAAGGSMDPFWDLYQQHDTPEVLQLLETLRIGNYKDAHIGEKNDDLWSNEPKRDPNLIMRSERPCNAETPKGLLGKSFITPNHLFYVRHHLPVPEIDIETYEVEVRSDDSDKILKLSIDDIKKFPKHTVTAALMCAGNRRSQMNQHKPTKGLNWGPGAVGNAVWAGARLKDILEAAGITPDELKHVQFIGADFDATGKAYGSSIPLTTAMGERNDVILAYEMNGKPIPRDHGFPIRAFIPGTVGARCVKWLKGIKISTAESPSHWQQMDYKGFNPNVDPDAEAYKKSTSIQFLPVTSAILSPEDGTDVKLIDGHVEVKGYAWAGGGQKILRVDLTSDQGENWMSGVLVDQDKMPAGRHWAWTMWTAKVPIKKGQKEVEIWVKAVDSNYNNQPDNVSNIWNVRGVLNNSFDKIKIKVSQ